MRRVENAAELGAAEIAGDGDGFAEDPLARPHGAFILAGDIAAERQAHGDDDLQSGVAQSLREPGQVEFLGIEARELDELVAERMGLLDRLVERFLRRTAGPDEAVNSEPFHWHFLPMVS